MTDFVVTKAGHKTANDLIAEIYATVGKQFPISIRMTDTSIISIKYSDTWNEAKLGESAKSKTLTAAEKTTIDNWIASKGL